jgi:hypothetical protein
MLGSCQHQLSTFVFLLGSFWSAPFSFISDCYMIERLRSILLSQGHKFVL